MADSFLHALELPTAWANQHAWRILDTDWQDGARFLACQDAWQRDPNRPRMLHYVAVLETPCAGFCADLFPGFHRLSFNAGQVLLTLCLGDLKHMLREQDFRADSIVMNLEKHPAWDDWSLQALLRCCRRGTAFALSQCSPRDSERLTQHGLEIQASNAGSVRHARFNPHWQLQSTRRPLKFKTVGRSNCAVIGAGLAGASTAISLARRGWQVQVLDAAPLPAHAASSLPVGLMAAPSGGNSDTRARMLKSGMGYTLQQARLNLECGQDWAPSGSTTVQSGKSALWQSTAAWIKPHRLVQAWLAHPGIEFRGNARVASMQQLDDTWILQDARNAVLAQASLVVLACAGGAQALSAELGHQLRQPLEGIHGQVSWAFQRESTRPQSDQSTLPPFPLNGYGHLVPNVPLDAGPAWFAGATYAKGDEVPTAWQGHQSNLSRLAQLHPPSAKIMAQRMADGSINAWQGQRFTPRDRLPLVGLLNASDALSKPPAIFINTGFGSRGLSWCVLCAELLAAQIGDEPLPVPQRWARLLRASP